MEVLDADARAEGMFGVVGLGHWRLVALTKDEAWREQTSQQDIQDKHDEGFHIHHLSWMSKLNNGCSVPIQMEIDQALYC